MPSPARALRPRRRRAFTAMEIAAAVPAPTSACSPPAPALRVGRGFFHMIKPSPTPWACSAGLIQQQQQSLYIKV